MKDAKGFDATSFAARSGFVSAIPQANEHYEPGNSPIAFGDWNTGCALTAGILGAYAGALRTGVGDKVTTSLYHVGTWGMTCALIAEQQGCKHPKDPHGGPSAPRTTPTCPPDGVWFLMCFGNYNKYCQLVFDTIEMDPEVTTPIPSTTRSRRWPRTASTPRSTPPSIRRASSSRSRSSRSASAPTISPFEKIQTVADVLADEEAFANDQLRRVKYEKQGPHERVHRERRVHRHPRRRSAWPPSATRCCIAPARWATTPVRS